MSICTIKSIINSGRREVSAFSCFVFSKVCYAGRYCAVLNLTDRFD